MKKSLFIGVDIGTTGIRAAVFDLDGKEKGYSYQEYPLLTDAEGMAELEPDLILRSFIHVIRDAVNNYENDGTIEGIGISSLMHTLIAVDKGGNCLTNAIIWADTRPAQEADFIEKNYDCKAMYQKTGCKAKHAIYYPSKVLWLRHSRPDVVKNTYKFITIKEYILYRLYGEYVIDITDASTTGCFNIRNFQWDEDIVRNVLGVQTVQFGEPVDCTHVLTGMKEEFASQMDVKRSVPMVVGSSDGVLANLGCGGVDSTMMSCTVGTSCALRIAVDKPLLDDRERIWCYCLAKDKWVAGGATSDGGIELKWFRDQTKGNLDAEIASYGVKNAYQLFDRYAEEIAPGSEGLIFLPYLMGERSPGWHADATAFLCGLKYAHDQRHIVRASMEGVLFNLYSIFEVLSKIDDRVERIVANGGYVHSKTWLQMQADIFNREIVVSTRGEASAWGAAFTAMVAVGAKPGFDSVERNYDSNRVFYPTAANREVYRESYRKFRGFYNLLIDK